MLKEIIFFSYHKESHAALTGEFQRDKKILDLQIHLSPRAAANTSL